MKIVKVGEGTEGTRSVKSRKGDTVGIGGKEKVEIDVQGLLAFIRRGP